MNFKSFLTVTSLSRGGLAPDKKTVLELSQGSNLIGRSPSCDAVLSYRHIPPYLCVITIEAPDRYIIQDLNQSWGIHTEENKERLKPTVDHMLSIDKPFYIGNHFKCVVECSVDDNRLRSPSKSDLVLSGEQDLYPSICSENLKSELHGISTLIMPTLAPEEYALNVRTQLNDKDKLRIKEEEFKATQIIEDFSKDYQVKGKNIQMLEVEKESRRRLGLGPSPKGEKGSREKRIELFFQATTPYKDCENEEIAKNNSNQKSLERSISNSKKAIPVHYIKEKYQDDDSFGLRNDDEQESLGKSESVKSFKKSFEKKKPGPQTQENKTEIEIENENEDETEKKIVEEEIQPNGSKKRKREENNSTSILKEFRRQDDLKKPKKSEQKPSAKSAERITIKTVRDSRKKGGAKNFKQIQKNPKDKEGFENYESPSGNEPYYWEKFTGSFPQGTVYAHKIYAVIRAEYGKGDFVLGKYRLGHRKAYIPYDGKEIATNRNVEVLVAAPDAKVSWITASQGSIVEGAVGPVGNDGLYVGRAVCPRPENKLNPGKIHPDHGCLYMPWDGKELRYDVYEVCVITF